MQILGGLERKRYMGDGMCKLASTFTFVLARGYFLTGLAGAWHERARRESHG